MNKKIDFGFEVIIRSVSAYGLDKDWLGKPVTHEMLQKLVELNKIK